MYPPRRWAAGPPDAERDHRPPAGSARGLGPTAGEGRRYLLLSREGYHALQPLSEQISATLTAEAELCPIRLGRSGREGSGVRHLVRTSLDLLWKMRGKGKNYVARCQERCLKRFGNRMWSWLRKGSRHCSISICTCCTRSLHRRRLKGCAWRDEPYGVPTAAWRRWTITYPPPPTGSSSKMPSRPSKWMRYAQTAPSSAFHSTMFSRRNKGSCMSSVRS